jgi:hypothetical protein
MNRQSSNIYARLDSASRVVSVRSAFHAPDVVDDGYVKVKGFDRAWLTTAYFTGETFAQRPRLPTMEVVDGGYSFSDLPEGAMVTIADTSNGELLFTFNADADNTLFVFSLPDPGSYQIELSAGGLYLGTTHKIEVK